MISRRDFVVHGGQALAAASMLTSLSPAWAFARDYKPVEVTAPCGTLRGAKTVATQRFLGIPFAQPPVGELRFKAPLPVADWQGIREATTFARAAIQNPQNPKFTPQDPGSSEDCLYLNVWAPTTPGPHPVYVWVHGGANVAGTTATPIFDGQAFAEKGVVLVSVAYRLGALGFMDVSSVLGEQYRGSGNNGLRDVAQALRWVKRNIAAFGGDPSRVTLGGESAGAKNVISLLAMPAARGLFQRAICESGGGQTFAHQAAADDVARRVLANLKGGSAAEVLLTAEPADLLAAQNAMIRDYPVRFPFRAVVDGVVLEEGPLIAIAKGAGKNVALLLGSNRDEAAYYGPSKTGDGQVVQADLANMPLALFESILPQYAALSPGADAEALRYKALTAESYGIPTLRLAEARAVTGAPAYCYRFELSPDSGPHKGLCVHGSELALVFGNVTDPTASGIGPAGMRGEQLGAVMHRAWVDFISGKTLRAGDQAWPLYSLEQRRTLVFGEQVRVQSDPHPAERQLWEHWAAVSG